LKPLSHPAEKVKRPNTEGTARDGEKSENGDDLYRRDAEGAEKGRSDASLLSG
jgi:hypothetical protein